MTCFNLFFVKRQTLLFENTENLDVAIRRRRWDLRFIQPFETQFLKVSFDQSRSVLRFGALLFLGTIGAIQFNVFVNQPQIAYGVTALLGFSICVFAGLALSMISFTNWVTRIQEYLVVAAHLTANVGILIMAYPFPPDWIRSSFGAFLLFITAPMAYRIRLIAFVPMQVVIATGFSAFLLIQNAYPTVTGKPFAAATYILSALFFSIVCSVIVETLARREFATNLALKLERENSERLLRNVMPDSIARRLMAGEQNIADYCGEASIIFADISGFTIMASETSPQRLVALLNEVFGAFDDLAGTYGLEKIKTMGDCYMAVAGVDGATTLHGQAAADCALGMLKAVESFNAANGTDLQIKIGIHTGPVVAGVIGKKKYAYDIWGDSVNLASRMQSHGLEGQIQIGSATFKLIESTHLCRSRGPQAIKGKGTLETWFVEKRYIV